MTKLTLKQKHQQRKEIMKNIKKEIDAFEDANSGNFERIFPLPIKEAAEGNQKLNENSELSAK